jgi:electron transport complex protein RnfC
MALIYDFLSEDAGLITKSVTGFFPTVAVIPLKHTDEDIDILIQKDSAVKEGQLIAKGSECSVHSSLPGKVIDICEQTLADGLKGLVAKIEFSGAFTYTGKKQIPADWKNYDSNSILMMLKEKGITNTFAKSCCLSNQISNLSETCSRILTVRLFSEDPSRCSDSFITLNFFEKIKTGAYIVAKAMNAKGIVFAYDSSTVFNPDFSDYNQAPVFTVGIDAKSYPCGFMHEIVQAVKNSTKELPFKRIGNRELFIDCQTALAVYDGIVLGIPLMSRYVHVTGDCLNAAAITKIRIGTTLKDLALQCGGFKRKTAGIIINGVVTGNTVDSMDIPVSKDVKSVSFIPQAKVPDQQIEDCSRCGNCIDICPVGLYPESLYRSYTTQNKDDDHLNIIKQTAILCTECALCNSVCPSRIPLSQIIKSLKEKPPKETKETIKETIDEK